MAEERIPPIVVSLEYEYKDDGLKRMSADMNKIGAGKGITGARKGFKSLAEEFSQMSNVFSMNSEKVVSSYNKILAQQKRIEQANSTYKAIVNQKAAIDRDYALKKEQLQIKLEESQQRRDKTRERLNRAIANAALQRAKHLGDPNNKSVLAANDKVSAAQSIYDTAEKRVSAVQAEQKLAEQKHAEQIKNNNAQKKQALAEVREEVEKYKVSIENALQAEDRFRETQRIDRINQVKQAWTNLGNAFKNAGKRFRQGMQSFAAALYVFRRIINFIKSLGKEITNLINASSSWIENLNLLEVVFGDVSKNAQKTKDWVSELAERFSMDKNAITQYISTFKQMANAMGQAAETGERMSEVLTQLGLDIASLRNVKTETAMSDLASAIAGQIKPVRKYGFDITSQSINALLKEAGIGGSVTDLTQSDKQLARTILLIRQSKDAWGDLGKTINTFANQQRVLNDQWETTKRLLGQLFIGTFQFGDTLEEAEQTAGIATKAMWHINGALIAFNKMLEAVLPSADSVNGAIATLGEEGEEEIDDLNDALNNSLASFDKFNVMSSGSGSGLLGGMSLQGLFDKEALEYLDEFSKRSKQIKSYASQISNQILGKLLPEYKEFYEKYVKEHGGDGTGAFAAWVKDSKTAKDALNNLVGPIVKIQKALEDAFSKVDIVSVLKAAGELAVALIQLFTPIVTFLADLINKLGVDGVLGLIKAIFWAIVAIKGVGIVSNTVKGISTIAGALNEILAPALAKASTKLADLSNGLKAIKSGSLDITETTAPQMETSLKGIGTGFVVAAAGASMLVAGLSIYHSVANNLSESTKKILKVVAGVAGAIIGLATAIIVAAHAVKTMGMGWAGAIAKGVLFGAGAAMAVAGVTMGAGAMIANATKHAQGGYQTGGLFYAGESGAEWVGSQGNTSTIVNDKQMSDIMQQSVAMGVIQGNRMSNGAKAGSGDGKVAVVNLDGKKLFEVVQQNGRRVGKVFAEA